ncbi:MAG TPA: Gfo/Idh/MocA family oxidoreductase [Candidatus Acidoferrales bacterium]|nr:Gfo/Idh/MocA family oxidoreductase [Candidatus Acidoferrales bacterium]
MSGSEKKVRVAVVGAGEFGRNHARVYREMPEVELVGVVDIDSGRAESVAREFGSVAMDSIESLRDRVDGVSLAVPTAMHAKVGCELFEMGLDVLVEKPIASSIEEADVLIAAAKEHDRILQIGHVERFNPAVTAAEKLVDRPLFFEVHRLGVFSARSLDVDVIFDVMIHDLDILLALVNEPVADVKAVGIPVLTNKVDIAHARLEFESGAVANVTASRVSTERVRKMRFFQSHEYISLDFARRDVLRVRVAQPGPKPEFGYEKVTTLDQEPLRAELESFVESVRTRRNPRVDGAAGRRALLLASQVAASIQEHGQRVQLGAFAVSRSDSK